MVGFSQIKSVVNYEGRKFAVKGAARSFVFLVFGNKLIGKSY